ncbi:MAG: hypothetical protein J6C75_06410 [Oscillospiraceae bacterium]|nr:hypothetical protein [Oscillospiraceae bacterium]
MNIRQLTEAKELRMSQPYVLTKEEFTAKGCTCVGTLGSAARSGFLTARACEKIGQPVTAEERDNISHFAIFANCYQANCIRLADGTAVRPCLPVFYRKTEAIKIKEEENG